MNDLTVLHLAKKTIEAAISQKVIISTAESCTGGLIGGALTSVSGSSAAYSGGFITYANEAKRDQLGVSWDLLMSMGAVSPEVAEAMAYGAINKSPPNVTLSVSVTGIAGPGGGTDEKPVGLVYFGIGQRRSQSDIEVASEKQLFRELTREEIRLRTVETALRLLLDTMN